MNVKKLARMANQIGANLDCGSHQARAVADTTEHLLRFWTREMRLELAAGAANGSVELSPIVADALDAALRPGASPQVSGTGGDAG